MNSKSKYGQITITAVPLILSTSGMAIMQFVDAMFLAWHSPVSIAASGSAGCIAYTISSFLLGIVGYTSVLTSNYVGANKNAKVGSAVWQGIHIGFFFGIFTFILSFFSMLFFRLCGHEPVLAHEEGVYLQILLAGGIFHFIVAALSGFFSGRADNTRLMVATLAGHGVNIIGDYVLIFGKFGFPEMGIAGAAVATVGSALVPLLILSWMFLSRTNRRIFSTWRHRGLKWEMMRNLLAFGTPSGLVQMTDAIMWSIFLIIMGRFGEVVLASSTVVFRLNSLSLMPVIGIARAASAFVGQCHGRRDHRETVAYMWRGAILCYVWMVVVSATFIIFPEAYFRMFFEEGCPNHAELVKTSTYFIYFVCFYCLADSLNVSLCMSLQAVGDTKWISAVQTTAAVLLSCLLLLADRCNASVTFIWTMATTYIVCLPPFWIWRLCKGKWKTIVVAR